jgi:hypothetical protein
MHPFSAVTRKGSVQGPYLYELVFMFGYVELILCHALAQYIIPGNSLLPSCTPCILYPFLSYWSTSGLYPNSFQSSEALPNGRHTEGYSGSSSWIGWSSTSSHVPWDGYDGGFRTGDREVSVWFPKLYLACVFLNSFSAALTSTCSAAIWLFYHLTLHHRLLLVLWL